MESRGRLHTAREVVDNRTDIIIKNRKETTCLLIDVAIAADGNVIRKEAQNELKYRSLCIEITANVEREVCDYTSRNWSHWSTNKRFKETFGRHTSKTFYRFTTKDSCTWNITHNTVK